MQGRCVAAIGIVLWWPPLPLTPPLPRRRPAVTSPGGWNTP